MLPDFLTDMAAAATGGDDKKKKKTPIVTLPKRSREAKIVDQLAKLLRDQKDVKGKVEALKAEILDFAVQRRNAQCSKDGRYHSSIKLAGASETLSVVTRGQYSKIPLSNREEIEKVLGSEDFDERFSTRITVKIDNEALQDPSNQGLLERLVKRHPRLKSMLDVSAHFEPKDSWVKTFMFSPGEQRIVDELEDLRIMKPYSPTFR